MKLTGKRCQCPSCKAIFSTVANFDKHRQGKATARHCVDPATVGLVQSDAGIWKLPAREKWARV